MDAEKLNQALYEKMAAEQERFKHVLLGMTTEEALNHAYEYAIREDILMEMETLNLPASQAAALLETHSPLTDIYKDFQDMGTAHMENIQECIEGRASSLLEAQREAAPIIPIYPHTGEYAKEHGELDAFRASRQANVACKEAIEAAIQAGYDGMRLKADVKGVLAEFGPERVSYVLAATIQSKDWDERFSRSNKAWAAAVPMFEQEHHRSPYIVHSHSVLVDGFVSMVRREIAAIREQPVKMPSIKEQLAASAAAQTKNPAVHQHQKDKETR